MSNGITAPFFLQHFTDPTSGKPISGGTVEYYVGGSTNIPKLVYADIALSNSLGNVLTLDAGGYAPQYYMLSGYYKIVLRRSNGAIVYTRDYVEGGANSSNGDHKFAINKADEDAGGAGYFQDKVVDSVAIEWEVVDVGDGVLQTKATLTDKATAKPIGPAGGDLFGTYPNPRVKELTGVPAMLTPSVASFNWKQSGAWASGAGLGFGYGYVNGVKSKVWMAISQLGELQVSYDEWKSTVYIPEGMPYRNSFTDYDGNTQLYNDVRSKFSGRYAAVTYLAIPGTGKYCWVFGAEGALFGLEDTVDNFYANGAPKLENMFAWSYTGSDPNSVNSNGTVMVFTGNSSTITYAEAADINWATKTISGHSATITGDNASSRGVMGGNGCDGSIFMAVGRDSGIVMQSSNGKDWTVVNVLSNKFQDGTAMTKTSANEYSNALPMNTNAGYSPAWGTNGNAWGGMLYANDMWIVVNGKPAPSTINKAWSPFMFSYDKSNWNGYMPTADELAVNYSYSMYKIAYGHGKTFATNSDPLQDYKNQPPIYRLLMDEIPAHRKLVAEKGMDVIGTLALLDTPNAALLGTDEDGNVIPVDASDLSVKPIGPAGGDLSGTYPNPLVDELSGSGNSFRVVTTRNADGSGSFIPDSDPFAHYSMAIKSEAGLAMFINLSNDVYFSKNGGLNWTFLYNLGGGSGMDITYGRISTGVYGWAVCGQNQIIWFEDLSGNYDSNGLPLLSAWKSKSRASSDWADIAVNNNTGDWFFALEAAGLFYSSSLSTSMTFTQVIPQGATGTEGGIFVDQTNNRIVYFEKLTGRVWWASGSSYANPTDWTEVLLNGVPVLKAVYPQMGVSGKGVGAGVECKNVCTFVGDVTIYATNVTDSSTYQRATSTSGLPKLWNVCTDGVNVFGTRDDWSWSGIYPYKVIFQLYNDVIPAHKTFVAEKDLVVLGNEYIPNLPNCSSLATDANGKVIAGAGGSDHLVIATAADTVPSQLVHKIVDSNGAELGTVANGDYGTAIKIPTTVIAGTPNGQELFNYSAYELKTAIAQDGSGQGNNYGTRGFAFIALSSRLMTKGRIFVPQTGGAYMRFGIYDNAWKLIAKSPRTAVFGGIIPFDLTIGYGGVAVAGAQLIGGERYYMAYWCDDTTGNLKFGCITGRNTDSDNPQPQIFLDNQEMPDTMGTSGYRTAFRPWMAVYEA